MARNLAIIRTNKWTVEEETLLESLRLVFGDHLVSVFHNFSSGQNLPVEILPIDDAWVKTNGLRSTSDWGWRCGDYCYYRARQAKPDYDNYWLIEPDVYFDCDTVEFFRRFDDVAHSGLGLNFREISRDSTRFSKAMVGERLFQAVFPLTRLSGRAVDYLFRKRAELSKLEMKEFVVPNDEVFTFTSLVNDPEFSVASLEEFAGGYFAEGNFLPRPGYLLDTFRGAAPGKKSNQIYHPVREKSYYCNALVDRMSGNFKIAQKFAAEIAALDNEDRDRMAEALGSIAAKHLAKAARKGSRAKG